MTLLFKTSKERSAGHWPLLAGWSQFRTLCSWVNNQDLDLKWPNDLWLQERKVGGCLCTMKTIAGSSWLSIGIGINVGAMTFPSELENIATTLNNHLTNTAPSLEQVAAAITDSILEDEAALSSNDLLRNYSSASSWIRLKDITWQSDGKTHSGTTAGLSLSGALRVSQTGVVQELTVSEIAHVRSATS
jgi:BirA family biotin operon repressor/biotin-[acetyl-CoA-carboxylase] ligase